MRTKYKVPHYETVPTFLPSKTATFLRDEEDEIAKTYKITIPEVSYVLIFTFWHTKREDKTLNWK
jgi:hypothetical protein